MMLVCSVHTRVRQALMNLPMRCLGRTEKQSLTLLNTCMVAAFNLLNPWQLLSLDHQCSMLTTELWTLSITFVFRQVSLFTFSQPSDYTNTTNATIDNNNKSMKLHFKFYFVSFQSSHFDNLLNYTNTTNATINNNNKAVKFHF